MPERGRHRRRPAPTAAPGPLRRLAAAVIFGAAGAVAATPAWGVSGAWLTDTAESDPVHLDTAPAEPGPGPSHSDSGPPQAKDDPGQPGGSTSRGEGPSARPAAGPSQGGAAEGNGRAAGPQPGHARSRGQAAGAPSHPPAAAPGGPQQQPRHHGR